MAGVSLSGMRNHSPLGVCLGLALLASCGRPIGSTGSSSDAVEQGCEGLTGTYLAHAETLSGDCGVLGDGTGPLSSFEDACTGVLTFPSTTGTVTWTTEASYDASGATGEAMTTLVRTGVNPCSGTYAVTFTRQSM